MFGTRNKIMWEEQLVDPPIYYLTCVIVPRSLVLNKKIFNKISKIISKFHYTYAQFVLLTRSTSYLLDGT